MYHLRLKVLREKMDKSQKEFAKLLDCSQTGYSKWELGQRDIPTNMLVKIAKIHDVSLDYLCGLTEEHRPFPKK